MEPSEISQFASDYKSFSITSFPIDLQSTFIESMISHPPANVSEARQRVLGNHTATLAAQWTQEDPAAASRWAGQLPAGEARQWALRNVAVNWMPYDPVGAQAWLERLPAADREGVRAFVESKR